MSQVFQVHLWKTVVLHKHPHAYHQHTAWDHSLQMLEPIKWKGSNQALMQLELWQADVTGHRTTNLSHQPGSDAAVVETVEQTAQTYTAEPKLWLQHICYEVIVLLTCFWRGKSLSGLFFECTLLQVFNFSKSDRLSEHIG